MANKEQLIAKATELQIEVPSNATKAEIEALIASNTVASESKESETTETLEPQETEKSPKEETIDSVPEVTTTAQESLEETKGTKEIVGETPEKDINNIEVVDPEVIEEELPEGIYKSDNGNLYQFTKRTPETLAVDGRTYLITELLTNNEIMEDLIASHCIFVQKL